MKRVDNKRVAKNTFYLYVRMLLIMGVTLYTTRVILKIIGVDDYGIYQLIAGFISLFSIISNSLVAAVQRYFNIALGKDDYTSFGRIYTTGINLLTILSVVLLVIAETVGLWFIKTQLNIPPGRETATFWVYQISVITLIFNIFRTTDNAAIIAHERMSFYAVLSIVEAFLKLGIVFILSWFGSDKLIGYTLLLLGVTIVINIIYKVYCNRNFPYCRFNMIWDKELNKSMLSFSWWTLMGKGVQLGTLQGENFFLNHYHSVAVNAARGVAAQVYNAINTFLANFQTAFKPQLVQTYVADDKSEHFKLLYRSARMSFFLLLLLTIPVLFNMDVLLSIWLEEVPQYTKEFCVFVLFAYLIDALSTPLATSINANGNIKGNQIMLSCIFVLQFICSFFALKMGSVPYIVSIFILCSHTLMFLSYLYYAHKLCALKYRTFLKEVLLPCSFIFVLSIVVPQIFSFYSKSIMSALFHIMGTILWISVVIWVVGIKKEEKQAIIGYVKGSLFKRNK